MAKPSIALTELVEKGAKDDIVRELLAQIVARLMDFEIEQRTGAEYGERTDDRVNSRNGHDWAGTSLEAVRSMRISPIVVTPNERAALGTAALECRSGAGG